MGGSRVVDSDDLVESYSENLDAGVYLYQQPTDYRHCANYPSLDGLWFKNEYPDCLFSPVFFSGSW